MPGVNNRRRTVSVSGEPIYRRVLMLVYRSRVVGVLWSHPGPTLRTPHAGSLNHGPWRLLHD